MDVLKRLLRSIATFYNEGVRLPAVAAAVPPVAPGGTFIPPAKVPPDTPEYQGVPVPKYPDHGLAVPAAPPEDIVATQQKLIDRLQQASGLSHADFAELIMPVIYNYACFVHLLPGSESHHHCAQGGLFRHGIEVAFYAARKCEGKVFALDHPPSVRKHLEPRWIVCAILGGMLHDLGKPQVDVGAVDAAGHLVWNPYEESLYAWLTRHALSYYFIMWHSGSRHKRHEARTAAMVDRMLPQVTKHWLAEYNGVTAVDAMYDALTNANDPRNPLVGVIKGADSDSVGRDVADSRNRLAATGSGGIRSLAARVVRAMHDQIASGEWQLNTVGGAVWVTEDGVFAIYPEACIKAVEVLRTEGDNSLPNDASAIADVLNEYGYLIENIQEDGRSYMTWRAEVHTTDHGKDLVMPFHGLRFRNAIIIPTTMVQPAPVRADLLNESGQILNPRKTPAPTSEPETQPVTEAFKDQIAPPPTRADVADVPIPDDSLPPPPEDVQSGSRTDAEALRNRRTEPEVRDEQMEEARQVVNATWPPETPQDARDWFDGEGHEGELLVAIADRLLRKEIQRGVDIIEDAPHVHLRYPVAAEHLGIPPRDVQKLLEAKGWTVRDEATPARGTVAIRGPGGDTVNALRLAPRIAEAFRGLIAEVPAAPVAKELPLNSLPLGPYISAEIAAVLANLKRRDPADGPPIRLAFQAHVEHQLRDRPPSAGPWTSAEWQAEIKQFAKEHGLAWRMVESHLTEKDKGFLMRVDSNPHATNDKSATRQREYVLQPNPAYDRIGDEASTRALLHADRGETT